MYGDLKNAEQGDSGRESRVKQVLTSTPISGTRLVQFTVEWGIECGVLKGDMMPPLLALPIDAVSASPVSPRPDRIGTVQGPRCYGPPAHSSPSQGAESDIANCGPTFRRLADRVRGGVAAGCAQDRSFSLLE